MDNVFRVTGPPAKAKTIVDIPATLMELSGENKRVMIQDVIYVPDGRYNIFSITKLMRSGWHLLGDMEEGLVLTKGKNCIRFERKVHTTKGLLFVARFCRRQINGETGLANADQEEEKLKLTKILMENWWETSQETFRKASQKPQHGYKIGYKH